jgi:hypothetical protein
MAECLVARIPLPMSVDDLCHLATTLSRTYSPHPLHARVATSGAAIVLYADAPDDGPSIDPEAPHA